MAAEENELEGVPTPGDVIVDKYRVDRVLGVGGMGCVVAATHLSLHQPVAIKFLLAKVAQNPKHVMRFQREAQAAARIKSDHVAKVSDVGTMPNGTPYMVMEFLEGEDLAGRLRRGPIGVNESVDYLLQACEALAEAHFLGIVHRDLKPANLFLARHSDGFARVKVLDFGISKITAPGQGADLTKTSALMGSPLYMSPEQMMSAKAADARTDIWALGCILFEALTCQPPFIGETLPEICSRILAHPPTSLRSLLPTAPGDLEGLVGKTLAKEPTQRFQNLGELAEALIPFATPRGLRSVNVIRRTLGQPELALGITTSPGSHPLSSSMPQHHSYPPPPVGVSSSASQSGPQRQFGVVTPIPGSTSDPFGAAVPIIPPAGVATHAPVAQTMSGERRRSRAPLFVLAGMVVLAGLGAGLFFGFRSNADSQAAEAPSAETSEVQQEASPEPAPASEVDRHGIEGDHHSSQPEPSRPTKSAVPAPPPPPISAPVPKGPVPKGPPPPPAPPSPKSPEVRPGDDKFNTFNP